MDRLRQIVRKPLEAGKGFLRRLGGRPGNAEESVDPVAVLLEAYSRRRLEGSGPRGATELVVIVGSAGLGGAGLHALRRPLEEALFRELLGLPEEGPLRPLATRFFRDWLAELGEAHTEGTGWLPALASRHPEVRALVPGLAAEIASPTSEATRSLERLVAEVPGSSHALVWTGPTPPPSDLKRACEERGVAWVEPRGAGESFLPLCARPPEERSGAREALLEACRGRSVLVLEGRSDTVEEEKEWTALVEELLGGNGREDPVRVRLVSAPASELDRLGEGLMAIAEEARLREDPDAPELAPFREFFSVLAPAHRLRPEDLGLALPGEALAPLEGDQARRVRELLETEGRALITGPPGSGRTRMAYEAVRELPGTWVAIPRLAAKGWDQMPPLPGCIGELVLVLDDYPWRIAGPSEDELVQSLCQEASETPRIRVLVTIPERDEDPEIYKVLSEETVALTFVHEEREASGLPLPTATADRQILQALRLLVETGTWCFPEARLRILARKDFGVRANRSEWEAMLADLERSGYLAWKRDLEIVQVVPHALRALPLDAPSRKQRESLVDRLRKDRDLEALAGFGSGHLTLDGHRVAARALRATSALAAEEPAPARALGRAYLIAEKPAKAAHSLRKAFDLERARGGDARFTGTLLATSLEAGGRGKEALEVTGEVMRQAAALRPESAKNHQAVATHALLTGEVDEGVTRAGVPAIASATARQASIRRSGVPSAISRPNRGPFSPIAMRRTKASTRGVGSVTSSAVKAASASSASTAANQTSSRSLRMTCAVPGGSLSVGTRLVPRQTVGPIREKAVENFASLATDRSSGPGASVFCARRM